MSIWYLFSGNDILFPNCQLLALTLKLKKFVSGLQNLNISPQQLTPSSHNNQFLFFYCVNKNTLLSIDISNTFPISFSAINSTIFNVSIEFEAEVILFYLIPRNSQQRLTINITEIAFYKTPIDQWHTYLYKCVCVP